MRHILLSLLLIGGAAAAHADQLVGNGTLAPLPMAPNTGPTAPGIAPVITWPGNFNGAGSFTGTFNAPAPAAWLGTFQGTGAYPCCGNQNTSSWNFAGLANGYLPAGTFMRLGDVDISETFRLEAFDLSNNKITGFWLDKPSWVTGGTPSQFLQANLPSFTWNNGTYDFRGASVNTLLTISLTTNVNVKRLAVTNEVTNGFSISAPETAPPAATPEPGTWAMFGLSLAALTAKWRRRH